VNTAARYTVDRAGKLSAVPVSADDADVADWTSWPRSGVACRNNAILHEDADRLGLEIAVQPFAPALASNPDCLTPPKGAGGVPT
jgi:hypothetical protein